MRHAIYSSCERGVVARELVGSICLSSELDEQEREELEV